MRLIQRIMQRVACAGALLGGLILALAWLPGFSALASQIGNFYGDAENWRVLSMQVITGILLAAVGGLALWPLDGWGRRRRRLVFPCAHGEVSIQLRSIEDTLTREVGALPEVRKIHVQVLPSVDPRKVAIRADVVLRKGLGSSAPELADSVNKSLEDLAKNIFGVEEVTYVKLRVDDIVLEGGRDRGKVVEQDEEVPEEAAADEETTEAGESEQAPEPAPAETENDWREMPGAVFTESLPADDDENNVFDPARANMDETDEDASESGDAGETEEEGETRAP